MLVLAYAPKEFASDVRLTPIPISMAIWPFTEIVLIVITSACETSRAVVPLAMVNEVTPRRAKAFNRLDDMNRPAKGNTPIAMKSSAT